MGFIPDPLERTVKIPIRIVNGRVEFFYGGPLPAVEDGTIGDLVVPAHNVDLNLPWDWLRQEFTVEMVSEASELWVAIKPSNLSEADLKQIVTLENVASVIDRQFVPAILQEPLLLKLRGGKKGALEDCKCYIPALDETAQSVNHAYRLISEKFEPQRRSHAGNVFERVYYQCGNGYFLLNSLREHYEARLEQHSLFLNQAHTLVSNIDRFCAESNPELVSDYGFSNFLESLRPYEGIIKEQLKAQTQATAHAAVIPVSSYGGSAEIHLKSAVNSLASTSINNPDVVFARLLLATYQRVFAKIALEDDWFADILGIVNSVLKHALEQKRSEIQLVHDIRQYIRVAFINPARRRGDSYIRLSVKDLRERLALTDADGPAIRTALTQVESDQSDYRVRLKRGPESTDQELEVLFQDKPKDLPC